jgi:hypothetical protein
MKPRGSSKQISLQCHWDTQTVKKDYQYISSTNVTGNVQNVPKTSALSDSKKIRLLVPQCGTNFLGVAPGFWTQEKLVCRCRAATGGASLESVGQGQSGWWSLKRERKRAHFRPHGSRTRLSEEKSPGQGLTPHFTDCSRILCVSLSQGELRIREKIILPRLLSSRKSSWQKCRAKHVWVRTRWVSPLAVMLVGSWKSVSRVSSWWLLQVFIWGGITKILKPEMLSRVLRS